MLLVGMMIAWRVFAGFSDSFEAEKRVVRSSDFDFEVIHSTKPVLVSFESPWCSSCRKVAQVVQKVGKQVSGKASIYVVNVDKYPKLAEKYDVRSTPSLKVFKDGEVVETVRSGDENTLRDRLLAHTR